MKRTTLSLLALLLVGPILLSSCSYHVGDFAMISPKAQDMKKEYRNVGRMEGSDNSWILFTWIPLGAASIEDAAQDAIDAGDGVYLANAQVKAKYWTIFLFGSWSYNVTGDVYAPVSRGEILEEGTETFSLVETENGLVMKSKTTDNVVEVQSLSDLAPNK